MNNASRMAVVVSVTVMLGSGATFAQGPDDLGGAERATGPYTLHVGLTTSERVATLLNLSPWQAWIHFYCLKDSRPACVATLLCGQVDGATVTWNVPINPKNIFAYYPNKPAANGGNFEAALLAADMPPENVRRRTTCEVSSPDPIRVRAYTRFGSETLIPVAVYE